MKFTKKNVLPVLAIVSPCYNEELMAKQTIQEINRWLSKMVANNTISAQSYFLIVDDGSSDNTLSIIKSYSNSRIQCLKLSRNYGHQKALLAGMHFVTDKCNCMISIDFDLQDDLNAMEQMIVNFLQGKEIVYGIRNSRETDTWFKRNSAQFFYKFLTKMGACLKYNHADFRLLSNRVLQEFSKYREINIFLRGFFPLMGFNSADVFYARNERAQGTTKYPFFKMFALALDGLTSFSNKPLRIISVLGFLTFFLTLVLSVWVFVVFLQGKAVPGWASIMLPIYFIAGTQLLCLGIIGEYISKIYVESKSRPHYHVECHITS